MCLGVIRVNLYVYLCQCIHCFRSIIPTAFLGTCVIFISFTLAALYSERRSFLYLGGIYILCVFVSHKLDTHCQGYIYEQSHVELLTPFNF